MSSTNGLRFIHAARIVRLSSPSLSALTLLLIAISVSNVFGNEFNQFRNYSKEQKNLRLSARQSLSIWFYSYKVYTKWHFLRFPPNNYLLMQQETSQQSGTTLRIINCTSVGQRLKTRVTSVVADLFFYLLTLLFSIIFVLRPNPFQWLTNLKWTVAEVYQEKTEFPCFISKQVVIRNSATLNVCSWYEPSSFKPNTFPVLLRCPV